MNLALKSATSETGATCEADGDVRARTGRGRDEVEGSRQA